MTHWQSVLGLTGVKPGSTHNTKSNRGEAEDTWRNAPWGSIAHYHTLQAPDLLRYHSSHPAQEHHNFDNPNSRTCHLRQGKMLSLLLQLHYISQHGSPISADNFPQHLLPKKENTSEKILKESTCMIRRLSLYFYHSLTGYFISSVQSLSPVWGW